MILGQSIVLPRILRMDSGCGSTPARNEMAVRDSGRARLRPSQMGTQFALGLALPESCNMIQSNFN